MKEFIDKLLARLEEATHRPNCSLYCGAERKCTGHEHKCGFDEMRKQAIEIVNQLAEEHKDEYYPKAYIDQVRWERDIAISQLNELGYEFGEKVGWIPCSERLPDRDLWCWATFESGNVDKIQYLALQKWWNGEMGDNRVIAWKPLPAPYQPKGE